MSLLQFEQSIVQGERPRFIRRQHCMTCHSVLALQVADKLDRQKEADYYLVKECLWIACEPHLLYENRRWFGNWVKCPVCGREGKLPIDKPIAWEMISMPKEELKCHSM